MVVIIATQQHVVASRTQKDVRARTAFDAFSGVGTVQDVIKRGSDQRLYAHQSVTSRIAPAACCSIQIDCHSAGGAGISHRIGAIAAVHGVGPCAAAENVIARAAIERVAARCAAQHIIALVTQQRIAAR